MRRIWNKFVYYQSVDEFDLRNLAMIWATGETMRGHTTHAPDPLLNDADALSAGRFGDLVALSRPASGTAALAAGIRSPEGPFPTHIRAGGNAERALVPLRVGTPVVSRRFWKSLVKAHWSCRFLMEFGASARPEVDVSSFALDHAPLDLLTDSGELDLMARLVDWPRPLDGALEAPDPSGVALYLSDLAVTLDRLLSQGAAMAHLDYILRCEPELMVARFALFDRLIAVIESGLENFGFVPVEEMSNASRFPVSRH